MTATVRVSVGDSRSGAFTQLQWRNSNGATGTVGCGCPEGSIRQWNITGVGMSTPDPRGAGLQRHQLVRVVGGQQHLPPVHDTKTPANLNGTSRNGNNITWRWTLPQRGREVDEMGLQLRSNEPGGGRDHHAGVAHGAYDFDGKPGYYYEIRVRATPDGGGWSDWTGWERVSIPNPQPDIYNVHKGPISSPPGIHRLLRDQWLPEVRFSIRDFPPGATYSVRCDHSRNGDYTSSVSSGSTPAATATAGAVVRLGGQRRHHDRPPRLLLRLRELVATIDTPELHPTYRNSTRIAAATTTRRTDHTHDRHQRPGPVVRPGVHPDGRERRPGRPRQAARDPPRADLPALRGPPAARGRPGHRQDPAGQGHRRHRAGHATAASSSRPTCCPATSPA